ncbi:MAG: tRNA threonylcarbamoyladenosine dehydratase [Lachnospiraceae bacterium]|nr:tRNA threonylcarbamoyladenosine dehydratase [Lachnospiraceae bacterium]
MDQFSRTELLIGTEAVQKLHNSTVAVFGIGGVGGFVVEALARSGVGHLVLVDNDTVSVTNINRQLVATLSTVGQLKTEVMKAHIKDINPDAVVEVHNCFYLPENHDDFDFTTYDYVVDAVDTVTAKLDIIMQAKKAGTPVISSMGAGNKLDPTAFEVADIYKTSVCPLAKVMRRELKARGVKDLKVVYSKEPPIKPLHLDQGEVVSKRETPGSAAFVPSVAGLILAGEVMKDLTERERSAIFS